MAQDSERSGQQQPEQCAPGEHEWDWYPEGPASMRSWEATRSCLRCGVKGNPDRWPELQPGEKVRLELEVTVGHPLGEDLIYFGLAQDGGKTVSLYLPVDHPQVRVTRTEPVDGVPQPGELWADQNGVIYMVRSIHPVHTWLVSASGPHYGWREIHTGPGGPIRRLMTAEQIASYR